MNSVSTTIFTQIAISVLLGSALGSGLFSIVIATPRWGAPRLNERISRYIRNVADPRGLTPLTNEAPHFTALRHAAYRQFNAAMGGSLGVDRRLNQANWRMSVATFRARQLAAACAGCVVGALSIVALSIVGNYTVTAAALPLVGAIAGAIIIDVVLSRAASARSRRLTEELPTVLEFLALCVAAGEGLFDALKQIGEHAVGELPREIHTTTLAVGTGATLPDALADLASRTDLPALARSVDHIVSALERGAPLAHVLQAQAVDAREDAKRMLIEQAGRKEIAMLVPLVFLILPLSVLFAVFPGIFILRLGFA